MAHSALGTCRRIGRDLRVNARAVASSSRIVAVLTILSLLAVASLRAQDRAPPTDGPKTAPSSPTTPQPAPPAIRVERTPEPAQPVELQKLAVDQATQAVMAFSIPAAQRFQFKIDTK